MKHYYFLAVALAIEVESESQAKSFKDSTLDDNVQINIMISMKEIILYACFAAVSCMWCTFLLVYWREIRMVIVRAYKKYKRA
jgi:hypothetical protein